MLANCHVKYDKRQMNECFQAMEHLQNFIGDCDRKTEMAKRRLKETQEELSEEANAKVIS